MTARKTTKSKNTKSVKSAPAKKSKKPKTAAAEVRTLEVQQPITSAGKCPKGGDHEWTEENGENFCSKCKEPKGAKPAKTKRAGASKLASEKKVSAIDAAAKLLAEVNTPMNCVEIIEAMASEGLWQTPGGKTPHATLYNVGRLAKDACDGG